MVLKTYVICRMWYIVKEWEDKRMVEKRKIEDRFLINMQRRKATKERRKIIFFLCVFPRVPLQFSFYNSIAGWVSFLNHGAPKATPY
jgi:hypothetical protein